MSLCKSVPVQKISLLSHRSYLEWLFTQWFSATPYRWVKWRVSDPSLVPFPFDCAGSQLVSKNVPRLHFVLEKIESPFQWCKASRANSILPEYNGCNPNEGHQSWESFASPSICSIGSLMPPDASPFSSFCFFSCLSTQHIAGTVPDPLKYLWSHCRPVLMFVLFG